MAELSAVTGITMIGLYSWSIDRYQPLIANCEMYSSINSTLSNNLTIGETYPDIFSPLKICEFVLYSFFKNFLKLIGFVLFRWESCHWFIDDHLWDIGRYCQRTRRCDGVVFRIRLKSHSNFIPTTIISIIKERSCVGQTYTFISKLNIINGNQYVVQWSIPTCVFRTKSYVICYFKQLQLFFREEIHSLKFCVRQKEAKIILKM